MYFKPSSSSVSGLRNKRKLTSQWRRDEDCIGSQAPENWHACSGSKWLRYFQFLTTRWAHHHTQQNLYLLGVEAKGPESRLLILGRPQRKAGSRRCWWGRAFVRMTSLSQTLIVFDPKAQGVMVNFYSFATKLIIKNLLPTLYL
jgi:hypothetical protein